MPRTKRRSIGDAPFLPPGPFRADNHHNVVATLAAALAAAQKRFDTLQARYYNYTVKMAKAVGAVDSTTQTKNSEHARRAGAAAVDAHLELMTARAELHVEMFMEHKRRFRADHGIVLEGGRRIRESS